MANHQLHQAFNKQRNEFAASDFERFFRTEIGNLSLSELKQDFDELEIQFGLIAKHMGSLSDEAAKALIAAINELTQKIQSITDLDEANFVSQRRGLLGQIQKDLDKFKNLMQPVKILELEATVRDLKSNSNKSIEDELIKNLRELQKNIEEEVIKIRDDTQEESNKILVEARKSAEGVSVKVAQDQFSDAVIKFGRRVYVWGGCSAVSVLVLVALIFWLAHSVPDEFTQKSIVEFAITRVGLLLLALAVARFCFFMLRINMHLRETNAHRTRLTNSISAFTAATQNPEQRDVVLSRLVEAVSSAYDPGYISAKSGENAPVKMSVENVVRDLSAQYRLAD